MGLEAIEKLHQLGTSKLPLKGVGLAVGEYFVEAQPLCDFPKTDKVVGREHLALPDGEVELHLVEPTGMDRRVHPNQIGIGGGQPADRRRPSVRRAVIDHPEDARRSVVGLSPHHLSDQAAKRLNAGRGFTAAHDEPAQDIPGRQVWQGAAPLVLVLDAPHAARSRGQAGRAAEASLNTRLLIGTEDVVLGAQGFLLPVPRRQIHHAPGLLSEVGVAGKDPILVPPGFEGSGRQNPPDRAATDRLAQRRAGLPGEVCGREPTQRQAGSMNSLTRHGLDESLLQGGTTRPCVLGQGQQSSKTPPQPSVASNTVQRWNGGAPLRLRERWLGGDRPGRATPTGRVVAVATRLSVAERALGLGRQSQRESRDDKVVRDLACGTPLSLPALASHTKPSDLIMYSCTPLQLILKREYLGPVNK